MKANPATAKLSPADELAAQVITTQIRKLHSTQVRLQELTGGEVDAVMHPGGHAYLLYKAQEKLRQSEVTQRQLAESQMAILNALPAHIALLNPQGVIISVNDSWKDFAIANELQSFESAVGQNYLDICDRVTGNCAEEAHASAAGIRSVLNGDTTNFSFEYPCHSPTEHRWFRLVATPMQEDGHAGAVIMHINITEAKKIEEQLLWKTAFFQAQVYSALDGILIVDRDRKTILQNQRLVDLWGIPNAFGAGVQSPLRLDLVTKQVKDSRLFTEKVDYLYDHPDEISRDEIELIDGKYLDRYSAPVRGQDGKYYGRIWTFRDITERKQAEFRLLRLNRLHTVLSKVSDAILRTNERQELYDSVCRIGVEDGAFRMVVIAEVDAATKMARPVASHGEGRDYLREPASFVPTDAGPLGKGTVGTAFRTGNPDFCNDIAGTARMTPWHKAAKKFALCSSASIPLKLRGATIGVLALFAGETDFFCDDEMRLMVSVANDISFALEAQEKEKERKQAGEALQRQKTELQVLFDLMPAMICFKDTENNFLRVNQQLAEASGMSIAEIEGKPAAELFPRDAAKYYVDDLEVIRAGKPKLGIIEKLRSQEGKELWVQTDKVPVRNDDGKVIGIVVMIQDITQRRESEESLSLFRSLVDRSPDAIEVIDPETCRFLDVNQTGWRRLGYSREEILSLTVSDLSDDKNHRAGWPAFVKDIKKSGSAVLHGGHVRKDGSIFPVEVNARYIDLNKGYVVAVVRDISERKRTESRLRLLIDSNIHGVLFWNRNGEITGANNAFLELTGYTRDDLEAGRINWIAMTPPEYAHLDRRSLEQIAATGAGTPYEKEYIRKDGSRVPIYLGAASYEDNPNEGVCFVLDITERKKLENQFLRAQRMESIGTLAGGIAHDLNNILAPILMSIHILRETAIDPDARSILETIEVSAKRGADIVRQVLSFARGIEGERIEIETKHLLKDLETIIKDTFPKDIRLQFSVPNNTWTILGDPTQTHQVFLNLCVNARDAMPSGGSLIIAVKNVVLDEQYAAMNMQAKAGRFVNINVTDSGTGMPPEVIEKIFEPFFTTKEVGKGTGLGLSTVMAIVKSHAGFVNVYSEPGKGTTFKIYLPAMDSPSEAGRAPTAEMSLPRGNGETVLLVDDEPSMRTITGQTLQAFGYRVLTATDGADAVAVYLAHRKEVAVVLTDMMMPVMDGPAMIHALMRINPEIKIIATSGLNANGGLTKVSEVRIKHFLTKPYTAGTLLKTLRAILEED